MAQALRWALQDYLNTGTTEAPIWSLCGTGFNTLDEEPGAQVETKNYINNKSSSKSISSYETVFPFDTDLYNDELAIMAIHDIYRNQRTGSSAEMEYIRTDLTIGADGTLITTEVPARQFVVSVEVSGVSGDGGSSIAVAGNLNVVGDFVDGTFNLATKTFTATGETGDAEE